MSDTKISALTAASALGGTEELAGVQSAANVKVTPAQIKTFTSASPSLVTPTLGVATATSINKVAITAPATSAALTIANAKTLTVSNTLTLTGTDTSSVAFGAGGAVLYSGGALGTPSSGTLTNATGLPAAGVVGTALTLAGGTLTGNLLGTLMLASNNLIAENQVKAAGGVLVAVSTSFSTGVLLTSPADTICWPTNLGQTAGIALQFMERTAPSAPATNNCYLYAQDNGSGKTQLMVMFPTGVAQEIKVEA